MQTTILVDHNPQISTIFQYWDWSLARYKDRQETCRQPVLGLKMLGGDFPPFPREIRGEWLEMMDFSHQKL